MESVAVSHHSSQTASLQPAKLQLMVWTSFPKAYYVLLTLPFILSLPLVRSQDRPHFAFLTLAMQRTDTSLLFHPTPLWLWKRIAMKGLCLLRSACPAHACLTPHALGCTAAEESVSPQASGQPSTAAYATCCACVTWVSVLTLEVPLAGYTPIALAFKQLSMKIVGPINITLESKMFTLRSFNWYEWTSSFKQA